MKCEEVQDQLVTFVSTHELLSVPGAITEHLQRCAECRAWLEEVEQTWHLWQENMLNGMPETAVNPSLPDLATPVMARLRRQEPAVRTLLNPGATLWHYGIAASLTLALTQLGIPQFIGFGLASASFALSAKLQALLQYASYL